MLVFCSVVGVIINNIDFILNSFADDAVTEVQGDGNERNDLATITALQIAYFHKQYPANADPQNSTVNGLGDGDAVLIDSGGERLLMDTGRANPKFARMLAKSGIAKFDIYISHYHADHDGNIMVDTELNDNQYEYDENNTTTDFKTVNTGSANVEGFDDNVYADRVFNL